MLYSNCLILLLLFLVSCSTPSRGPISVILPGKYLIVPPGANISLTCKVYRTVNRSLAIWRSADILNSSSADNFNSSSADNFNFSRTKLRVNTRVRFDPKPYFSSVLELTDLQLGEDRAVLCHQMLAELHVENAVSEVEVSSVFTGGRMEVECRAGGSPPPRLALTVLTYNHTSRRLVRYNNTSEVTSAHYVNIISTLTKVFRTTTTWSLSKQDLLNKVNLTCRASQNLSNHDNPARVKHLNKTVSITVPRNLTLTMSPGGGLASEGGVVSGRVVSVTLGGEVEVVCEADSYPPPLLLVLTHNNILLASNQTLSGDTLTLHYTLTAARDRAGTYICSAAPRGECGEVPCSTNFSLYLQIPVISLLSLPDLHTTLSTNSTLTTLNVRRGSHPYVKCIGSGVPSPIQVSLKVDDTYISYTTARDTDSGYHGNTTDEDPPEGETLVTGRFVPVNKPTRLLCVAWQDCDYVNCTQTTGATLLPSIQPLSMSRTKATLLFFSAFGGSFLSLVTLYALFLICVDSCSDKPPGKKKKSPNRCSPTASIRSILKYLNTKTSVNKRRRGGTKRLSIKDVKFSPVSQEAPPFDRDTVLTPRGTNHPIRAQHELSPLSHHVSPDSKQSRHLSWDGTFEKELLEELEEIVVQCNKEFETESLCSGCNDLRGNCVGKGSLSVFSDENQPIRAPYSFHATAADQSASDEEENVGLFLSACELSEVQRRFLSPAENDYESLEGFSSPS